MGFQSSATLFGQYCLIMVILAICGHSIGMFCGILFADASKVTVMIPMMMVPLMLFSGVFNNLNDIPKWISWLQYLTPFKYGTHVLLLNVLTNSIVCCRVQQRQNILSVVCYN